MNEPLRTVRGDGDDEQRNRLTFLVFFRLVVVTFLFMSTFILQARSGISPDQWVILVAVGASFTASIGFALALRGGFPGEVLGAAQIIWDIVLWSVLVVVSGGAYSPFSFLYTLSIFAAGFVLGRAAVWWVTPLSIAALVAVAVLDAGGVFDRFLHIAFRPTTFDIELVTRLVQTAAMFGFAGFLTNYALEELDRAQIAELKRYRMDYEQQRALNRSVALTLIDGLLQLDEDGFIRFVNRAVETITGFGPEALLGLHVDRLFPGLSQALGGPGGDAGDGGRGVEMRFRRTDAERRRLVFTASPLIDEYGVTQGRLVLVEDVTERRRLESQAAQNEKLAAVGRLAAAMAHEIRNPLASMSGSIQLLAAAQNLSDTDKRLMGIVVRESQRLDRLITEFLQFARPRPPAFASLDLVEFAAETAQLVGAGAGPDVRVRFSSAVAHAEAEADRDQLRQVLLNLTKNAVEAVRRPGFSGEVHVHTAVDKEYPSGFVIIVDDNGPGLSAEAVLSLFQPFESTKPQGTGLGLALSWQIVQGHGGRIDVDRAPEGGARFIVRLPADARRARETRSLSIIESAPAVVGGAGADTPSRASMDTVPAVRAAPRRASTLPLS